MLEQIEVLVDGFGEAELTDQKLNGADATAGDGLRLGGNYVEDVAGGEDRFGRGLGDRSVEPPSDFPLARSVMAV